MSATRAPPEPVVHRSPALGDLPRTIAGVLLAGVLAPVIFGLLMALGATLGPAREFVGLLALTVFFGGPCSIATAVVVGLPGIYLARRLHLASIWIFAVAGSVLALGCTALFAQGDVKGWIEWMPFASVASVTGATCGVLCWWIAERPRCIIR